MDHQLRVPANTDDLSLFLEAAPVTHLELFNPLEMGNLKYDRAIDYVEGNVGEGDEPPKGVFDSGMPGAMSLEQLQEQTDLGTWLIQIEDQITTLEV